MSLKNSLVLRSVSLFRAEINLNFFLPNHHLNNVDIFRFNKNALYVRLFKSLKKLVF